MKGPPVPPTVHWRIVIQSQNLNPRVPVALLNFLATENTHGSLREADIDKILNTSDPKPFYSVQPHAVTYDVSNWTCQKSFWSWPLSPQVLKFCYRCRGWKLVSLPIHCVPTPAVNWDDRNHNRSQGFKGKWSPYGISVVVFGTILYLCIIRQPNTGPPNEVDRPASALVSNPSSTTAPLPTSNRQ